MVWGRRIRISNKFSGNADAAGPDLTLTTMVFDKQQSVSAEILKYMIEFPRIECLEYEKSFAKPLLYQVVNNIIMSIVKSKSLMTF